MSDRQAVWAFVLGCVSVTVGVLLHLPMFLTAAEMDYRLAGMPSDPGMEIGMGLIILGVIVAGYGLLPRGGAIDGSAIEIAAPEDAHLSRAHWQLMLCLVVALAVDIMKPASLGFTMPGLISEYGVSNATASVVPFFALLGTVIGSVLWGVFADTYGRRATILLSAVMFIGTSVCGTMPSLAWNAAMCFMMGAAAGGMLPVSYALLAEMMPSRHRGWSLVLVGGLGAVGGYFAASGFSALLQPIFGWRVLWLLNLPTGLLLVLLSRLIPESARFLMAHGMRSEAQAVMRRFGTFARAYTGPARRVPAPPPAGKLKGIGLVAKLTGLSIVAIAWGFVNFGLLLWLPADLVAQGYSVGLSSKLLAESSLIAFPTVFVSALLYSRWSTKWSLVTVLGVTICGLLGVIELEAGGDGSPVFPIAVLIIGSNGIIAILLPYAAECFPLRVRGRATGWVAACTKGGGLFAQVLGILALVPPTGVVAVLIIAPAALALVLIARFGLETRGRDLRELDALPT